ncbi:hypothetical protein NE865_11597 [Phthorimaea operculella]|nr:hypothetical protein NE865_11597 [Phthorimaea operculella]
MARGRALYVVIAVALLGEAFSLPALVRLPKAELDSRNSPGQSIHSNNELGSNTEAAKAGRLRRSAAGLNAGEANDLESAGSDNRVAREDSSPPFTSDNANGESKVQTTTMKPEYATPVDDDDDDDDDDDFEPMNTAPSAGGGSNIFSLLRLANALFPSSSGANQSKTPSGEPASPVWTLKMDILRALLQFGTSILGQASSSSSGASTG